MPPLELHTVGAVEAEHVSRQCLHVLEHIVADRAHAVVTVAVERLSTAGGRCSRPSCIAVLLVLRVLAVVQQFVAGWLLVVAVVVASGNVFL